ncbi:TetR/AcrR family transcriptional regulator [Novosphingobium sp. ZN18A2]|uniref:TetR/AcrR family transcriptional regulator n=1 Tax=Novosphingobium sp. ZN18A2 TaxID=3079861 RepID=UPI0030D39D70
MSHGPNQPIARQHRSKVTHDLLCDAAEEALREGGLALCTIQEVARRAGRSGASVYRRFGDKDRMIIAVIERYLERMLSANEVGFKALAEQYPRLEERLKVLVEGAVASQRRDARLVRAFRDAAARSSNDALTAAMVWMRDAVLDLARRALRDCSSEIARQDKEQAITFAVDMLMGALEVLTNNDAPSLSDGAYQSELYDMLYGYLSSPAIDARS